MTKRNKIILLVILLLVIGFVRESFFYSLNFSIDNKLGQTNKVLVSWKFLESFNVSTLNKLKWVATIFFAALFYLTTIIFTRVAFPKINHFFPASFTYIGIFILAGCSIGLGYFFPGIYSTTYYFSRWLMGAAQSPLLPSVILIILYYLETENKNY